MVSVISFWSSSAENFKISEYSIQLISRSWECHGIVEYFFQTYSSGEFIDFLITMVEISTNDYRIMIRIFDNVPYEILQFFNYFFGFFIFVWWDITIDDIY
jgi:hypothetical protein